MFGLEGAELGQTAETARAETSREARPRERICRDHGERERRDARRSRSLLLNREAEVGRRERRISLESRRLSTGILLVAAPHTGKRF